MYCLKCGKETENENQICDECAQENENVEVVEETSEQPTISENKTKGILSLVFGIIPFGTDLISLILSFIPLGWILSMFLGPISSISPILAIVFGCLSRKTKGAKLGKAGLILGIVFLVLQVLAIILLVIACIVLFVLIFVVGSLDADFITDIFGGTSIY